LTHVWQWTVAATSTSPNVWVMFYLRMMEDLSTCIIKPW